MTYLNTHADGHISAAATRRKNAHVFLMDFLCVIPYYTLRLCKALTDLKVDVTLGSMTYDLDPTCFRRNGVRNNPGPLDFVGQHRIQRPVARRVLKALECCINMAFTAGRFLISKPDVVHVQQIGLVEGGLPFELWFLKAIRRLGVKIVLTVHNLLPHDTEKRHWGVFSRLYRSMDTLICHTSDAKERLIADFAIPASKIWIIPHGPLFHDHAKSASDEVRRGFGLSGDDCLVAYQGFIKPYKGIPFLLEAWRAVQSRGLKARLVIAGGGEKAQLEEVEQTVARLGIGQSVILQLRYLSPEEVSALYQAADIMVYPYRQITTSGALMTGVAMRKAIVASNLPAFRSVLEHGRNADLVEYGDVSRLAAALTKLIADPVRRSEMAAELPDVEESSYSWARIAHQTLRCYLSTVADLPEQAKSGGTLPDRSQRPRHDSGWETSTNRAH